MWPVVALSRCVCVCVCVCIEMEQISPGLADCLDVVGWPGSFFFLPNKVSGSDTGLYFLFIHL